MGFHFDERAFKRKIGQAIAQSDIKFACPECGTANHATAQDVASHRVVTCIGCQKTIGLHDKDGNLARTIRGDI